MTEYRSVYDTMLDAVIESPKQLVAVLDQVHAQTFIPVYDAIVSLVTLIDSEVWIELFDNPGFD